ncbi:MAG: hypothetical protein FWF12_11360 [Betaproteobacteria bacterium]|nr:hypothetical protein [Betaproteobacteria bacterium]
MSTKTSTTQPDKETGVPMELADRNGRKYEGTFIEEEPPELPKILSEDDLTVTVRMPRNGKWRRFLLSYHDSKPQVSTIPESAVVMPVQKIMNILVTIPCDLNVCTEQLFPFYASLRRMVHDRVNWKKSSRDALKKALSIA